MVAPPTPPRANPCICGPAIPTSTRRPPHAPAIASGHENSYLRDERGVLGFRPDRTLPRAIGLPLGGTRAAICPPRTGVAATWHGTPAPIAAAPAPPRLGAAGGDTRRVCQRRRHPSRGSHGTPRGRRRSQR